MMRTMSINGRIRAAIIVAALLATILAVAGPADAVSPNFMRVAKGTIGGGQSLSALAVQDQTGTQDTWLNYIEFMPDSERHVTFISTRTGVALAGQSMTIDLNYRGPESDFQRWVLHVRNRQTDAWERVWVNPNTNGWTWTEASITVEDADQHTDIYGRVLLRWLSVDAADVSQLDYLDVTLDPLPPATWTVPAGNVAFDYQIGQPYALPSGVGVVSRDWFDGTPAANAYNVCYVNAFQTQDDDPFVDRIDEQSNWPQQLVLYSLGDDPNWGGEYLIDISTASKRNIATGWVTQMLQGCADKGFDAVEFDNLDSWTRFDGTPIADQVPFGKIEALVYARKITEAAHDRGLAVAQKNTASFTANQALNYVGFDFAVVESCGVYNECEVFTGIYGDKVVAIEYSNSGFAAACAAVGNEISVVRRDVSVTAPGSSTYVFDEC